MRTLLPSTLLILFYPFAALAEVRPNALFSDHSVLQRGEAVPIWGEAAPGETITVSFRDQEVQTEANQSGDWRIDLRTGPAGGPFELIFRGENNEVRATDVWVGEVWLASGQSNMDRQLGPRRGQKPIDNGMAEAAKADYPRFRMFTVVQQSSFDPLNSPEGEWIVCSPETVNDFSAVAFFFGRDLLADLDVPIGIIRSSWGGTPAEAWTSEEAVSEFPKHRKVIEDWENFGNDGTAAEAAYFAKLVEWVNEMDPASQRFANGDRDFGPSERIFLPQAWEDAGYETLDGVVWLRRQFDLPSDWAGKEAILFLGRVDDMDTTWINGREIGTTLGAAEIREYTIPSGILRAGQNELLVRVLDSRSRGGLTDTSVPPEIFLKKDPSSPVLLSGEWDLHVSLEMADAPHPLPSRTFPRLKNSPGVLYNGMIAPLIPYAIRGVIWYQGESNSSDAIGYRDLFPAMAADWRARWGRGDFPFLFVQIAPYKRIPPELREAQLLALGRMPNSAMVVTMDVGDAEDVHPTNKEPVGERLALAASALAYPSPGDPIVYSGPIYEEVQFEGAKAVLSFSAVGPGLIAGDGEPLRGFTIAGSDGLFHPARAEIAGEQVIVSSDTVTEPVAVRYGWANVPDGNLFNRAGLPASPFRTDVKE